MESITVPKVELFHAVARGDLSVYTFIEWGGGLHWTVGGRTLLHESCSTGNLELVKILVTEFLMGVNLKDIDRRTPLHYACMFSHSDIVKFLLEQKADVLQVDINGKSILEEAIQSSWRSATILKMLFKYGADILAIFGPTIYQTKLKNNPFKTELIGVLKGAGAKFEYGRKQVVELKEMAAEAVRCKILACNTPTNMFIEMPKLQLPHLLEKYMLHDVSLADI